MAAPAVAAPHLTVQSQVQHYLECLNWLYTDQAKHREFCEPGHDFWFDDNTVHQAPHGNYPLPVPPGVAPPPPPTDNCPPKEKPAPVAYVTGDYAAALLPVTMGGDCPPPHGGCDNPYGSPAAYVLTGFGGGGGPYGGEGCHDGHPEWPPHGGDCNIPSSAPLLSSDPQIVLAGMRDCGSNCDAAYSPRLSSDPQVVLAGMRDCGGNCDVAYSPLQSEAFVIAVGAKGNDKPKGNDNDRGKDKPKDKDPWEHDGGNCSGYGGASYTVIENWSNELAI